MKMNITVLAMAMLVVATTQSCKKETLPKAPENVL